MEYYDCITLEQRHELFMSFIEKDTVICLKNENF